MNVRLPPFKSIEAFVVAARTLSFTEAATVLHITVPAVSRRIQALESELGVALFRRTNRILRLTPKGSAYYGNLSPAVETICRASEQIRGMPRRQSVKINLPASLAANWLIPRLSRFHARHRAVQVDLESLNGHPDFDDCDADLAIWLGTGNWPGVHAERLLDIQATPVCSAEFLAAHGELRATRDLLKCPLLGIKGQPDLWLEWFRNAGVIEPPGVCQEFDNLHLLYHAAASGLGVALGVDAVVQPYLKQAQLVRPFDTQLKLTKGYYVVCRAFDRTRRPTCTVRDWLMEEAARYTGELNDNAGFRDRTGAGGEKIIDGGRSQPHLRPHNCS